MEGLLLSLTEKIFQVRRIWTESDPNNIDSDGDTLPDGWGSIIIHAVGRLAEPESIRLMAQMR